MHKVSERDNQYLYESRRPVTAFGFTLSSSNPSRQRRNIRRKPVRYTNEQLQKMYLSTTNTRFSCWVQNSLN